MIVLNVGATRLAVALVSGAAVAVALCVAGCATTRTTPAGSAGSSQHDSSPSEGASAAVVLPLFAAACGHPGVEVVVVALPVTVSRKGCDLTGVIVRYGPAGVIVPAPGEGTGAQYDASTGATSLYVDVDAKTGDVTIH